MSERTRRRKKDTTPTEGIAGPQKGEFVQPAEVLPEDRDEAPDALPAQEEFWRPPVRFGSVPVEKEPLGWDKKKGFRKLFPQVMLPTQVVERVSFGHPELEPNRLFWGDNLHVMRQLPSESIDLIYIDPPFFSGRQYNVIFGDQNELRSFSDIWEGGIPGYLIWLNARLYEMKRLLKKTGSIVVHCDWHASHYIKVELDKIFGHENFVNEIVWCYKSGGASPTTRFSRKHDTLLAYARGNNYLFNPQKEKSYNRGLKPYRFAGVEEFQDEIGWYTLVGMKDYWEIDMVGRTSSERIGYPTQKPEAILERLISALSPEEGVIADFFVGGGTTPAVAQRLGRRWIACDQSRVAVAITADRLAKGADQLKLTYAASAKPSTAVPESSGEVPKSSGEVPESSGEVPAPSGGGNASSGKPSGASAFAPIPDFTIEHWGVYEAKRLSETPPDQFREFILRAFGATPDSSEPGIHGHKGAVPVWVGEPSMKSQVTAKEVQEFANAVRKTVRYQQDNLRDGIMLAWAFRPDAIEAAQRLREMEHTDVNFIRLEMIRIDSPRFREHIAALSTDHADYENFLTFIQPPQVEVGYKKLKGRIYAFDVSETVVMNPGAKIINVQWDFDHNGKFKSTQGYSFIRKAKKEPVLQVQYEFPRPGKYRVACKVQDDMGGEGMWVGEVEVEG